MLGFGLLLALAQTQEAPLVHGWRIQVFATLYREKAERIKKELESKIDLPVYIVEVLPLYKVRVGDFTSREEAEARLDTIRALGYEDAWIVEDLINPGGQAAPPDQ